MSCFLRVLVVTRLGKLFYMVVCHFYLQDKGFNSFEKDTCAIKIYKHQIEKQNGVVRG